MRALRQLNAQGINRFRDYLEKLRIHPDLAPPLEILYDSNFSKAIVVPVNIESREFDTRIEMLNYLNDIWNDRISIMSPESKGLWSWLSLFYFDQVCPENLEGKRKPGKDYRHILEQDFRTSHRHLLAGPFSVFKVHGLKARLLLWGPVFNESQIYHQLVMRQDFISNSAIIEAADVLYFDSKRKAPKRGILSKSKRGNLFRFINVIQQLDMTFDLYSLTAEGILFLLPYEFDEWKSLDLLNK